MADIISPALLDDYYRYREEKGLPINNSTKKQTNYSVLSLNRFMAVKYPTTSLAELRPLHMNRLIEYLTIEKKLKNSSINTKLSQLNSFFYFCIDNELIDIDPLVNVDFPEIPVKTKPCITQNEFLLLIESIKNSVNSESDKHRVYRDLAFIHLLSYSACSLAEIVSLKVTDIDFNNNFISFRGINRPEPREIPISSPLAEILLEYKDDHRDLYNRSSSQDAESFFQCNVASLQRVVKKFSVEALGKSLNVEDIRASRINSLLTNNYSVWAIAKFLGIHDLTRLRRYIPDLNMDLSSEIEKIKTSEQILPQIECNYLKSTNKRNLNRNIKRGSRVSTKINILPNS